MRLDALTAEIDSLLRVRELSDYPNALNGLQVENSGEVRLIVAAVDACEAIISGAVDCSATLLLVHHGLFWGGLSPVTGAAYRKLRACLAADLAVYSAHLPLDAHPVFGNNALLANALGLSAEGRTPFLDIGWQVPAQLTRSELRMRLAEAVGGQVHLAPGGPEEVRQVGIVTGGAGSAVAKAVAEGVDTFITGEGPHWSYTAAEELGVNLFYAGHYATETFGVRALAQHLSETYDIPWQFLDHPTGL